MAGIEMSWPNEEPAHTPTSQPPSTMTSSSSTQLNQSRSTRPPPWRTSNDESKDSAPKARPKQAHSVVERKYRNNLNAKMKALQRALQATQFGTAGNGKAVDKGLSEAPTKFRKSDVLAEALNYVHQTELEMRHMSNEIHSLRERESHWRS